MELLNSFQDHEVLNAFKLALINTSENNHDNDSDKFYENVGRNFMNILRHKSDSSDDGLASNFGKMNIQNSTINEPSVISDFGDVIPIDLPETGKNVRKHQKWTTGEKRKLTAFLSNRNLNEISEEEWEDISLKLNRTRTSVFYKSKDMHKKLPNMNKKRKVIEEPLNIHNDTISEFSMLKPENSNMLVSIQSEPDSYVTESKRTKTDSLCTSRKKIIASVLQEMPGKCGSKINIFDAISKKYNIDLNTKSTLDYKGFQQCLCKYFKNEKGFYLIKTNSTEYESLEKRLKTMDDCTSWKEKTFFILNRFPNKRATIDELKLSIESLMNLSQNDKKKSIDSNLESWEKNLLKTLSRYDSIFDTSNAKTVYCMY